MKDLFILGATGSIGRQTLDIIKDYPDKFRVVGLSLGHNLEGMQELIDFYKPKIVCLRDENDSSKIKVDAEIYYGNSGLIEIAKYKSENEMILINALVGSVGLKPTVEAIKSKKDIALANKETLVMAGEIINSLISTYKVKMYPIDSEHSAIWQCLTGENIKDVDSLIITASGGSFRDKKREELVNVTKEMALAHPNWKMGPKITIDSATMMNKGFEVIEAHHLFNVSYDKIKTVLHKESIVHSLVSFKDKSIKASLGVSDMRIPILYALSYPTHLEAKGINELLFDGLRLSFDELSYVRYPLLKASYDAGIKGKFYPVALNAANEAAVKLFLDGKISFLMIEEIVLRYQKRDYDNLEYNIDEIIKVDNCIQNEILKEYGE